METLYSEAIRNYIHSQNWPKGFIMDTREHPGQHLQLVCYQDNLKKLYTVGVDRLNLRLQLMSVAAHITNNMGVPCFLEVEEGNGE